MDFFISWSTLMLFSGAALFLILVPGPDLIFTVTQGLQNGRKAGVLTALGLSFGNIIHTLAAALGLSVIVMTSATIFNLIKIAGAIYLFYLAYKSIKYRKAPLDLKVNSASARTNLLMRGFFMNILNPKVAIFFITFLPQFVEYNKGAVPFQMIQLGLIFIILTAIVFGLLGFFAGTFGQPLLKKPKFAEGTNIAGGIIFFLLGIKLLTVRR